MTSLFLRLEICFKTFLILSSWQKKLKRYAISYFYEQNKSASGLQITAQFRDITNSHHLARGIADPNFNFIPCLEPEVYALTIHFL